MSIYNCVTTYCNQPTEHGNLDVFSTLKLRLYYLFRFMFVIQLFVKKNTVENINPLCNIHKTVHRKVSWKM